MTVKSEKFVTSYVGTVAEVHGALDNLREFVQSLPAPDESGSIHGIHYGHIGDLDRIRELIAEASRIADQWGC